MEGFSSYGLRLLLVSFTRYVNRTENCDNSRFVTISSYGWYGIISTGIPFQANHLRTNIGIRPFSSIPLYLEKKMKGSLPSFSLYDK